MAFAFALGTGVLCRKAGDDAAVLTRAMRTVEPDAKIDVDVDARAVKVDSWLFAEEFLVAFVCAGNDVKHRWSDIRATSPPRQRTFDLVDCNRSQIENACSMEAGRQRSELMEDT